MLKFPVNAPIRKVVKAFELLGFNVDQKINSKNDPYTGKNRKG